MPTPALNCAAIYVKANGWKSPDAAEVDVQMAEAEDYCKGRGLQVSARYSDGPRRRDSFHRMMADAESDDPTSRRVIGFARREHATRLTMVNVYAARTTDPKRLKDFDDPVGAANDRTIAEAARDADLIIAAWGRPPGKAGEARAQRVLELLTAAGDVYRLGAATRDGHPPHPLYLPASEAATPLQLHAPRRASESTP